LTSALPEAPLAVQEVLLRAGIEERFWSVLSRLHDNTVEYLQ